VSRLPALLRAEGTRLDRDEGGQISALAVLGATALACLLLWVVNTGYAATRKVQLQNAADASALSAGMVVARGLNVISMNNVTETQLLAVALVISALQQALPQGMQTLMAEDALCGPVVPCHAFYAQQMFAVEGLQAVASGLSAATPALWAAMSALGSVSQVVATTTPPMTLATAISIADQNAGALAMVLPVVGVGPPFPVTKGTTRDLCSPAKYGSGSSQPKSRGYELLLGYPAGKGPLTKMAEDLSNLAVIPTFASNVFAGVGGGYFQIALDRQYLSVCGRSSPFPFLLGKPGQSEQQTRLELRYLAVLQESRANKGIAWGSTVFHSPWLDNRLAYAQSKVYNSSSFDMFTQDWRAKLMPADRLDDGTALASPWTLPHSEALERAALFGQRARLLNH